MSEQKFKPFDRVLVRIGETWNADFYSHTDEIGDVTISGGAYPCDNIIPYGGNEHLLGTSNDPAPKWQPKPGEPIFVRDNDEESWKIRLFVKMHHEKYLASTTEQMDTYMAWSQCKPYKPNSEEE